MKNTINISVLVILVATSFTSSAQSFNMSGGLNLTSFNFFEDGKRIYHNDTEEYTFGSVKTDAKMNSGFNASLGYEFKLNDLLNIETGLSYSTKGFVLVEKSTYNYESYSDSRTSKNKFRANYLDLPIALNIGITNGDLRVYGKAGGYFGFGMLANVKYESFYTDSDGITNTEEYREGVELGDGANRFNYGMILGLGAEYKSLFMEVKYSLGLMNDFAGSDWKIINSNLGISLGYKFKKNSQ